MPYRYFGRTNQFFGRPLWEILMNLKSFGKGRLITKSGITREYPDVPSFYKIVGVHPHIMEYKDAFFKGNIFVEEVYCGRKRSEVIDIGEDAGLADYALVQKADEETLLRKVEEFLANSENHKPVVRPRTAPLPPVWREIIAREKNISYEEVPEIPLVYEDINPEISRPTRLATEGEEPDFRILPQHVKPLHPEFYQHVISNREAAREKYCGPPPDPDFIYAIKVIPPLHIEKSKESSSAVNQ